MDDFSKYLSNSSITLDINSKFFSNSPVSTEHDKHHLTNTSTTLENDIEISDHNIAELQDNTKKNNNHLRESGVQDVIGMVHLKKKGLMLKRIEELTKKIEEKYEANKTVSSSTAKPIYFARDLRYKDGLSSLETSCMKAVRELCELISTYFEKEYSSEVGICDDERKDVITTEEMWRRVEELSCTFGADEVSQAILQSIVATTKSLKDLTSRVDLDADAENLKFKFEAGKLKDISFAPALLKTVRQLIEMGQISHFQRFVASEKSKNETVNLKKKLHKLNLEINNILMSKFDSRKAALIQRYFMGSQEKASGLASSRYLEEELTRLRTEQAEREATMAELMENYNKIQNFDKSVQAKQLTIQKLIQVNGSAKSGHWQQHRDILCLIEEKAIKKKEAIADLSSQYRDITSSIQCFTNSNNCKLVRDMGIHCLNLHLNNSGVESLNMF